MADLKSPEDDDTPSRRSAELLADSTGDYVRIWAKRISSGESGACPSSSA